MFDRKGCNDMQVIFLVAVDRNNVMGYQGGIPWYHKEDVQRFKRITTGYPVVMGRKTWDSLPNKPLKNRYNVVLTKNLLFDGKGCYIHRSLEQSIHFFNKHELSKLYVIGGAEIFKQYMYAADIIDITYIDGEHEGDVFWPGINTNEWRISSVRKSDGATFVKYERFKIEIV